MKKDLSNYLFDHIFLYNDKLYELRDANCLIPFLSSSLHSPIYIDEKTTGLVVLPHNSLELVLHYIDSEEFKE